MTRLVRTLALAAAALTAVPAAAACDHLAAAPRAAAVVTVHVPPRHGPTPLDVRRAELTREYRELEHARERFYSRWNGNPRKQRKFESWYAARRAELDREWYRINALARNDRWHR